MSMSEVINSIKREMVDRATREENEEMIGVINLKDDNENERRSIKGRKVQESYIHNAD